MATDRKVRESLFDIDFRFSTGASEHVPVTEVETDFFVLVANKIGQGENVFVFRASEATSELLWKDRCVFDWTQHEDDVDSGDVDTFVEEIDREQDRDFSVSQVAEYLLPVSATGFGRDCSCPNICLFKLSGHKVCMCNADAETEHTHVSWVADFLVCGGDNFRCPDVVGGVDVGGFGDIIFAFLPGDTGKIRGVVNAEVMERGEQFLFERIPSS